MMNRRISYLLAIIRAILAQIVCSCTSSEEGPALQGDGILFHPRTELSVSVAGPSSSSLQDSLYILVYSDDARGLLESVTTYSAIPTRVQSTLGRKRLAAVSGIDVNRLDYRDICSWDALCALTMNLGDDAPASPVRSGVAYFDAGPSRTVEVEMGTLQSCVEIESLTVDFSSQGYPRQPLTQLRAYLTNVCGRYPLIEPGSSRGGVAEILNCGGYDERGCKDAGVDGMLFCSDPSKGARFYCYPRKSSESDAVGPTRLVIEGRLGENTYYYPLDVGGGEVEGGARYVYRITVSRPGTTDPDVPVDGMEAEVNMVVSEWKPYDEEVVEY